jgi:hypothetical protein
MSNGVDIWGRESKKSDRGEDCEEDDDDDTDEAERVGTS